MFDDWDDDALCTALDEAERAHTGGTAGASGGATPPRPPPQLTAPREAPPFFYLKRQRES